MPVAAAAEDLWAAGSRWAYGPHGRVLRALTGHVIEFAFLEAWN